MFNDTQILQEMIANPSFDNYLIYGDLAYGCRRHIISAFKHSNLSIPCKSLMSSCRQYVEWYFHLTKSQWSFIII
jgi:hypothetical protein